ncbi:hypothetical protein HDV04_000797 [Boothiomyces sp. JEL0838]|nr:hypothetical protein HDV04_000797 [Boothiomyces sp. JEL0838]
MTKIPNKPKRPINAFFRYKRAMRDYIKQKYNVTKNSDIAIIGARLWENEDQAVKKKYAKDSEEEYAKYNAIINTLVVQRESFCPSYFSIDVKTGFTPSVEECEPILRYIQSKNLINEV